MASERTQRVEVDTLLAMKGRGEKIAMVTAYDYPTGRAAEAAGVDIVFVGDSVGNTILGYPDTLPVTMEDMLHHTKAVARARKRALLLVDMPFLSFQVSPEEAVRNGGRLVSAAGADAVKMEAARHLEAVERLVNAGIPVMGHLGYTPQFTHVLAHGHVQAKTMAQAAQLCRDAQRLLDAGCFGIVVEYVPMRLTKLLTQALPIPTIGIGSGPDCDGQVLVLADLLGLQPDLKLKHVRRYAETGAAMEDAIFRYANDVRAGRFPTPQHGAGGLQGEELTLERVRQMAAGEVR
ncbi:MAG: 3-methyl-2-oxobutanoate hydroxymethyltransferase [Armatimonadota bacterium]